MGKGPKPPFLNKREIHELAVRLKISDFAVVTVLQVAGHALRERYRKRGWIERKREKPPKGFRGQNPPGTGRTDVNAVVDDLLGSSIDTAIPQVDTVFSSPDSISGTGLSGA